MVENCMLKISATEIGDDQLLFGPDSLGLDSIDALQLVVALEKEYQLKFSNPEAARTAMKTVKTIAAAIQVSRTGNIPLGKDNLIAEMKRIETA